MQSTHYQSQHYTSNWLEKGTDVVPQTDKKNKFLEKNWLNRPTMKLDNDDEVT
jgi:hypothetical protein